MKETAPLLAQRRFRAAGAVVLKLEPFEKELARSTRTLAAETPSTTPGID